ncbi:MAG: nuclear transport factor 2 family protein [Bacteroidales bacterium]|nr:nuclear transport factor 2 family protein [Bacteroidales bacterium]
MTDKEQIEALYENMYKAMIAKDTATLGKILSDDSVLVHMTGHRQSRKEYFSEIASGTLNYYSFDTDSLEITVNGDSATMIGKSRVNAAVYGGGRHTWRLRMDSRLEKIEGRWRITFSRASTY